MTARASSTLLVGRDAELARLRDALKRARGEEPSAVLIGGEAGIGKTRLVGEFIASAAADGVRVLTGHCLELGEEGLPFAPFAAALRDLLRRDGSAAFAGHEQDFARLLPELGPAGPENLSDARRGHLFDLVADLFARLATRRPLVLVIEDLHWADRSTRDLIAYLVRSARSAPVLLAATYRSDELHRGHPLRPFLAELDRVRGVERLDLHRLDRDCTAEILHQILGVEPVQALVDNIFDRAQGNPFFIEELAVCTDPEVCDDLPGSLRDLLLAKVDQLDEAAQRVLRIFAAGGSRVSHRLLTEVSGMPESELEAALRAAVAAQLVVAHPDGGYEFRHALVHEAVHDDLLPGEHVRLHARYAAVIDAHPELVSAERAPAEVAHHWHAAHQHPRALVSAVEAAKAASRRYAYAEQSRLLERVLTLWEQVPDAAALLGMEHLDLLEANVEAASMAGDYGRAIRLTAAALSEVDEGADPLRAARLLERRGKLMRTLGKGDGLALLVRAYGLISKIEDPAARAVMLADVAGALAAVDPPEGMRVAQEAIDSARALGDVKTEVSAKVTVGRVCGFQTSAEEGLAATRLAAERAAEVGDSTGLVRAMVNTSHHLYTLGRYAESIEAAQQGLVEARRVGISRTTGAFLLANGGEALLALGRWDEADAFFAESDRLDPPGVLALPGIAMRARLRLFRAHPAADDLLSRAFSFLSRPYLEGHSRLSLHELRITCSLVAGDPPAARSAALAGLADPELNTDPRYSWPVLVAAARVVYEAGFTAAAETRAGGGVPPGGEGVPPGGAGGVAGEGVPPGGAGGVAGEGVPPGGAGEGAPPGGAGEPARPSDGHGVAGSADDEIAVRVRHAAAALPARYPAMAASAAEVAALLAGGDPRLWRAAVAAWRADGQAYPLGRTLLCLAAAAAATGDRACVVESLAEAGTIAESVGAAKLREAVEVLGRRVGLRAGGRRGAVPATGGELTPREVEVLRLVSEGYSNRRIAERLYISPKTASVHVSRIIAKLSVANRVEAAAVAHRLGLLLPPLSAAAGPPLSAAAGPPPSAAAGPPLSAADQGQVHPV